MKNSFTFLVALGSLGFASCKDSEPRREYPSPDLSAKTTPLAPETKRAPGPETKRAPADNPLSEMELGFSGTWAATVDARASHSSFFAGKKAFEVPSNKSLAYGAIEALEGGREVGSNCVWMELYQDRTGYRFECVLINGVETAVNDVQVNPITGAKTKNGVAFRWNFQDGKTMKIVFEEDLKLPTAEGELAFREWHLQIVRQVGDKIEMSEHFPTLDAPELTYGWEIYTDTYLD